MENIDYKKLAIILTNSCVRNNTSLENLHSGIFPSSKTEDNSDIKVISPYGVIEFNRLSRISDDEIKKLLKEIVNNIYTFLTHTELFELASINYPVRWDEPEINEPLLKAYEKFKKLKDLKK